MFKVYFGEVSDGRLQRLAYFGYAILLMLIVMGAIFGAIMFVGGIESRAEGTMPEIQAQLMHDFGIPAMIAFVIFMLVVTFSHLNIMAKRFRDMGLPGWLSVLGVIVLGAIIGFMFPATGPDSQSLIPGVVHFLLLLILLFVPSGAIGRK